MPKLRIALPTLAFLAITAINSAAAAQDCNNAQTQAQMTECAAQAHEKADRKLNETYKEIASRLADEPAIKAELTKAQRAWIAFRDAECDFANAQSRGGTLHNTLMQQCLTGLTDQRSESLQAYLQCEEGDMSCPVP